MIGTFHELSVLSHGYGAGHEPYIGIIQQMTERGWCVIAYDMTGCATSDGDAYHGLTQAVYDLNACLDYIEGTYLPEHEELTNKPLVLMGHSNGAYATAMDLRRRDPQISVAVVVSGFNKPMDVTMEWGRAIAGGWVDIAYPAAWINTHLQYGADEDLTAVDGINSTQVPVLIMHGAEDTSVGYSTMSIISHRDEITNPNASFVAITTLDADDHSGIFSSSAAGTYRKSLEEEAQKRADAAGMSLADYAKTSEAKAWAETWDKQLGNEPNPDFYDHIDEFLSQFTD
ncbi:MAG: alpha/beta hydrolase [Coriobacteriaceae bacterium]|nr:alpha/beta hydrolase [Coriobacteriaceae bacterium]